MTKKGHKIKSVDQIIESIRGVTQSKTDTDLANDMKIDPRTLASAKKRGSFSYEVIQKIISFCLKSNIPLETVFRGNIKTPIGKINSPNQIEEDDHSFIQVNVYHFAGAGSPVELTESEPVTALYIPKRLFKSSMILIQIRGQSMEKLIMDKAIIIIDTSIKRIISGCVYCCWMPNEGAIVRKVHADIDKYILEPENKEYPTYLVPYERASEHFIVGKVEYVVLQEMPVKE